MKEISVTFWKGFFVKNKVELVINNIYQQWKIGIISIEKFDQQITKQDIMEKIEKKKNIR